MSFNLFFQRTSPPYYYLYYLTKINLSQVDNFLD